MSAAPGAQNAGPQPLRLLTLQGAVDSEGKPVDAAFYRTFWGLQSYFRWVPGSCSCGTEVGSWNREANTGVCCKSRSPTALFGAFSATPGGPAV